MPETQPYFEKIVSIDRITCLNIILEMRPPESQWINYFKFNKFRNAIKYISGKYTVTREVFKLTINHVLLFAISN